MRRYNTEIEREFVAFLKAQDGKEDGTASTYHRALVILNKVFERVRPDYLNGQYDIWKISSPSDLMRIYEIIKEEQTVYNTRGEGIFAALNGSGLGKCYYKNRWCSAAIKQFASFWLTRAYTQSLDVIMGSSQNAQEVVDAVDQVRFPDNKCFLPDEVSVDSREGRERICEVKTRVNQSVFRKWVLGLYGYKCCVTGLNVQEVLRASHIVAWADDKKNRMNPSNGLCLSATYDAAFDRHLISFDEDYRMVLSKSLRDRCLSRVCKTYFESREGLRIDLPEKYLPDQRLLERHRERLVK